MEVMATETDKDMDKDMDMGRGRVMDRGMVMGMGMDRGMGMVRVRLIGHSQLTERELPLWCPPRASIPSRMPMPCARR